MLHEILLAMLGQTGDVIQEKRDGFVTNIKIDFISDPEREMIDKIIQLGHYYSRIESFLEENYREFANIGSARAG